LIEEEACAAADLRLCLLAHAPPHPMPRWSRMRARAVGNGRRAMCGLGICGVAGNAMGWCRSTWRWLKRWNVQV